MNVSALKNKAQQINYIAKLGKNLPDLKKRSGTFKPVDGLEAKDFDTGVTKKPRPKPKPPERKTLIPRDCYLTVSNPKIAEIVKELRRLQLAEYPHSISVLFSSILGRPRSTRTRDFLTGAFKDMRWLISYDNVDAIRKLNTDRQHLVYAVSYSARHTRQGIEVMFLSDAMQKSPIVGPLKLIEIGS